MATALPVIEPQCPAVSTQSGRPACRCRGSSCRGGPRRSTGTRPRRRRGRPRWRGRGRRSAPATREAVAMAIESLRRGFMKDSERSREPRTCGDVADLRADGRHRADTRRRPTRRQREPRPVPDGDDHRAPDPGPGRRGLAGVVVAARLERPDRVRDHVRARPASESRSASTGCSPTARSRRARRCGRSSPRSARAAIEGPVISWVADHRKHHAYSDQPGDPHSPHVDHGHGLKGALRGTAARARRVAVHPHRSAG